MKKITESLRRFFKRHYLGIVIVSLTLILEIVYFYLDFKIHGKWVFERHISGLEMFTYFIIFVIFAFVTLGGFISDKGRLKRTKELENLRKMNFIETTALKIFSEPSFEKRVKIAIEALNKLVPCKELYVIVNIGKEFSVVYPNKGVAISDIQSGGIKVEEARKYSGKIYRGYYVFNLNLYDLTRIVLLRPAAPLTKEDINILLKYKQYIEPLFDNARLIIALKESKNKMEKLLGRYKLMHKLTLNIQKAVTSEEVYWMIVKTVLIFFDADFAFILDVSGSKNNWKFVAVKNTPQDVIKLFENKFTDEKYDGGIIAEVINKKRPMLADHLLENAFSDDFFLASGESWLWIPFIEDDGVTAVLAVRGKKSAHFDSEDVVFAYMLSDVVSGLLARIKYLEKLDEYSITDPLTGLYNKRRFYKTIFEEIRKSELYGNKLSFVMFDLDGFKEWNDMYGHIEGDKLLREIGDLLRKRLRTTDIPFRFGGDEFAILMPGTSAKNARIAMEHILPEIENLTSERDVAVTISAGIAEYKLHENVEELVERADRAMYIAKNSGKNRVEVAD